ncbi:MAG: nuclear transport factor 2 family protein [Actinobacteria bacterium]|nr:nuclear transport factor 2 family protein [Actinomycetota bacterium]
MSHSSDRTSSRDRDEISDLLIHYAYCIDTRQTDRLAEVFAADVVTNYGYGEGGEWIGAEMLIAGIGEQVASFEATAHMITNIRISLAGDTASSTCYVTGWHWVKEGDTDPERGADFLFTAAYVDDLRRESAGWRISRRRVRRLGPSALTLGSLPDYMRPQE